MFEMDYILLHCAYSSEIKSYKDDTMVFYL